MAHAVRLSVQSRQGWQGRNGLQNRWFQIVQAFGKTHTFEPRALERRFFNRG